MDPSGGVPVADRVLSDARHPVGGFKAGLLRREVGLQGALVPPLPPRLTVVQMGNQSGSVNRVSLIAVFAFSLLALSTIAVALSAALLSGHPPRPEPDEGTGAHIFQLSIALLMPAIVVFLATANWARPGRVFRALAIPAGT